MIKYYQSQYNMLNGKKNIVIVTPARSGSSWLVSSFGRENYNEQPLSLSETNNDKKLSLQQRIDILNSNKPFVTKVFTDEMIDLELLKDNDVEFIWLYRRNLVEHFLSNVLAWRTQVFNLHQHEWYWPPTTLNITDDDLNIYENIVKCQKKAYKKYKDWFTYEIAYEDLFTNNPWNFKSTDDKTVKLNHYSDEWIALATNKLQERNII